MRKHALKATDRFAQDLEGATAYYLERVGEGGARHLLDEYDKFCDLVSAFSGYGSPVGDTQLRWRKIDVFVAVYSEDAQEGEVLLMRLYYLSANWKRRALDLSSS